LAGVSEVAKVIVVERKAKASVNRVRKLQPIWVANFLLPSDEPSEGVSLQVENCQMHLFFLFRILGNKKIVAFVQPSGRLLDPTIFRE
jgi:hypothetical protein